MTAPSLSTIFDGYFRIVPATTEELIKQVYQIRHRVYCEELRYEPERPDRLEFDDYDLRSVHCLLRYVPNQEYVGCVRLVLADPHNSSAIFPFESVCKTSSHWHHPAVQGHSRALYGEISRLAIISQFRRRRGEAESPDGGGESIDGRLSDERRRFPSVGLGLYIAITAIGLKQGLEGVFAMMEPRLARQLQRFGINFEQVGNTVEHRGLRAPFFVSKDMLYQSLKPEILDLLSNIETQISTEALKPQLVK